MRYLWTTLHRMASTIILVDFIDSTQFGRHTSYLFTVKTDTVLGSIEGQVLNMKSKQKIGNLSRRCSRCNMLHLVLSKVYQSDFESGGYAWWVMKFLNNHHGDIVEKL